MFSVTAEMSSVDIVKTFDSKTVLLFCLCQIDVNKARYAHFDTFQLKSNFIKFDCILKTKNCEKKNVFTYGFVKRTT